MRRYSVWGLLWLLLWLPSVKADEAGKTQDENADTIIISEEDISAMQALKIADVLNHVPGVKAGDSSISIHGSYKVKVFVDGRPINDPTSSYGAVNWDLVSPDNIARIEILRGKGGLRYGQDAAGGVVLIRTKDIQHMTGNIKVYGGSHDTLNAGAVINATAGRLTAGLSSGYETTKGYKTNNDKIRRQAGLNLGYAPEGDRSVAFSVDYLQDERGLSGMPEYPTPHSRKETRNTAYALQADIPRLKSKTHYNEGYQHNTDPSRNLDKTLRVNKFGQDLTTAFNTFEQGELNCGAGMTWDRASGSGFDDQEEHSVSLFTAQSLSWPRRHFGLTAGLRANWHSTFDNVLNPEVKLVYKQPAWRLTAAYSRTQNTPSFYQRYNETSSTRPNPGLDMEKADNFSLALFATPHAAFSFSLSAFYNLLTDRITYVTGENGIGQYQNVGEVLYTGGDAALTWKVHTAVKVKASYTYLDVKDRETHLWLPGKARHTADLTLYWQPCRPFSVVSTGKYTSDVYRDKNNTRTVPAYTVADIRAEYGFKRFSLFGEVKNIFDETYYYADGLLAPPRSWVLGVNVGVR